MKGFKGCSVCVWKCTEKVQKGLKRPEKVKPASHARCWSNGCLSCALTPQRVLVWSLLSE
jgi:hypothetical protein